MAKGEYGALPPPLCPLNAATMLPMTMNLNAFEHEGKLTVMKYIKFLTITKVEEMRREVLQGTLMRFSYVLDRHCSVRTIQLLF